MCSLILIPTYHAGAHSESVPGKTADWTESAKNAVECGLLERYTSLSDGLKAVFDSEKENLITQELNSKVDLPVVPGARGRMVEMFGPETRRVYEIVLEPGFVRGNHCHKEQHETFYISEGYVAFEFQPGMPKYLPEAQYVTYLSSEKREKIKCEPTYMHTLWNPSPLHSALCIVSSTQAYVPNCSPDTYWPQNDVGHYLAPMFFHSPM